MNAFQTKKQQIARKKNLGIEKYIEKVLNETNIGKGLKQTGADDKKALEIKCNTAYYLAKKKDRPAIILNFKNCWKKTE